jgi:hypothetical protein
VQIFTEDETYFMSDFDGALKEAAKIKDRNSHFYLQEVDSAEMDRASE